MAQLDTISRQEAIFRICTFCDGLIRRNGRPPSALSIRDSLTGIIRGLPSVTGVTGSTGNARPEKPVSVDVGALPLETRETADRVIDRKPFLPGGTVGTEVYRCGACKTQVYGRDRFCRGCGRELVKTDKKVVAE